ncbi:MAG TPA: hypothetical protein VJC06_03320 [Candidatus Paceibacterota bacterium]
MSELTKEYLDKTKHELKNDIRTEVGVLFEDVHDKLDLILESQHGIRDDVKTMKNDYGHIDTRVSKTEI